MTPDEYQVQAHRFCSPKENDSDHLAMGGLGLAGESTEFLEEIGVVPLLALILSVNSGRVAEHTKKTVFHKKGLTSEQVDKYATELGDVIWYVAEILTALNLNFEDLMQFNIEKLSVRHGGVTPLAFGDVRANNQDLSFTSWRGQKLEV